ncbi:hypothetical protein [Nonomuraea sp. NPDC049480]|uniref:hypothetical protein n=1 Tax=Nonomuraea sp. NPDC049480 TaxID=3364353 RepID=UPI0037B66E46
MDSPLTTPDPSRPFAGRPPRGAVPPAAPGVIVPDAPVSVTGSRVTRLREIARDGFLLLSVSGMGSGTGDGMAGDMRGVVDDDAVLHATRRATRAPVRLLRLGDIDHTGALARALAARPGELWIVRPDAHIAAVPARPTPGEVTAALRRALGGTLSGTATVRA